MFIKSYQTQLFDFFHPLLFTKHICMTSSPSHTTKITANITSFSCGNFFNVGSSKQTLPNLIDIWTLLKQILYNSQLKFFFNLSDRVASLRSTITLGWRCWHLLFWLPFSSMWILLNIATCIEILYTRTHINLYRERLFGCS